MSQPLLKPPSLVRGQRWGFWLNVALAVFSWLLTLSVYARGQATWFNWAMAIVSTAVTVWFYWKIGPYSPYFPSSTSTKETP